MLTKHWTDWVDDWAVDFNYESRKEMIKVPKGAGVNVVQGALPGQEPDQRELDLAAAKFEERWTGAYIVENEWQSFRTRQNRNLDLTSVAHTLSRGRPVHGRCQGDRHLRQRHDDARASDGGIEPRASRSTGDVPQLAMRVRSRLGSQFPQRGPVRTCRNIQRQATARAFPRLVNGTFHASH